jgi:hypothetical protein
MRRCFAVVTLLVLAGAGPAAGQNRSQLAPAGRAVNSEVNRAMDQVAMTHALMRFGTRNEEPMALVTAAQILMDYPVVRSTAVPQAKLTDRPVSDIQRRALAPLPEMSPAALLKAAATMVDADDPLSEIIAEMTEQAGTTTRGATGGQVVRYATVANGYYQWWDLNFDGGEYGRVVVSGDGNSDLDCYAIAGGAVVDSDEDNTDFCILEWWQVSTGPVQIQIHNRGSWPNAYVLVTN